ncbi:MAG: hypothetical protein J5374_02325 [Bacteroidales bacterium]|nr:hypothetical protein [Bacteroidales bacterium]
MKFFRNFLKGASLTTALFIFQACYGTGPDRMEPEVAFKVVSALDGSPIEDISVFTRASKSEIQDWSLCGYTNYAGYALVSASSVAVPEPEFRFADEKGVYAVKDTVIADYYNKSIEIRLQKAE